MSTVQYATVKQSWEGERARGDHYAADSDPWKSLLLVFRLSHSIPKVQVAHSGYKMTQGSISTTELMTNL